MKKRFDYVVFIARAQPLHIGHLEVIRHASELADQVIMLIGSSDQPRTIKNPFSFNERRKMVLESYADYCQQAKLDAPAELAVIPLLDFTSNDTIWATNVQKIVDTEVLKMGWTDYPRRGAIIGHKKDESSFYLDMFPQWELIEHGLNEEVNATDIRTIYFESNIKYLSAVVPNKVMDFLEKFKNTTEYTDLVAEHEFIKQYKKAWAVAPYPPVFVTTDIVLIQSSHILLIKRKASPGKGLWALPGGFVNQNERIVDAAFRELREETGIKVPIKVLKGSVVATRVFDTPNRSLRGRTITHAYYIELPAGELPKVRGGDDAQAAKWVPLAHIRNSELFEDHGDIIRAHTGNF